MNNVLDMAVVDELLSLSDDGDPELLLDLIRLFLDDGPGKIAAVTRGLQAHDFEMMERAAHSLKGSSGNLGARALQNTCELMQLATRNHDFAVTQELVPQMARQYEEVRQALEGLRQRYT
jgi:HPt (histidine-containing phosphotransfer) domain-containing protein